MVVITFSFVLFHKSHQDPLFYIMVSYYESIAIKLSSSLELVLQNQKSHNLTVLEMVPQGLSCLSIEFITISNHVLTPRSQVNLG